MGLCDSSVITDMFPTELIQKRNKSLKLYTLILILNITDLTSRSRRRVTSSYHESVGGHLRMCLILELGNGGLSLCINHPNRVLPATTRHFDLKTFRQVLWTFRSKEFDDREAKGACLFCLEVWKLCSTNKPVWKQLHLSCLSVCLS